MSRWHRGWAPYVPVAERRRRAERALAKRRQAGQAASPVAITGRAIAATFWGKAWCDNIESYRDFESRLPRGRTYVRNGSVLDLRIAPGRVDAVVCGSELYDVMVTVAAAPQARWRSLCADCAGGIDSVVELLQGRFSGSVMARLCRQQGGLFPLPSEIRFACSCPDYADMCKHVAAVLYGVGARLDQQPELLFRLRGVDETELVAEAGTGLKLATRAPAPGRVLRSDDVAALFGLDMADGAAGDGGMDSGGGRRGRGRRGVSTPASAARPAKEAAPAAGGAAPQSAAAAGSRPAATGKASAKPGVSRGASAKGTAVQAAKNAAATRPTVRTGAGMAGHAARPTKASASGAGKGRRQAPGESARGTDDLSTPKPAATVGGTANVRAKAGAARKRAAAKAATGSGGQQKPIRW